MKPNFEKLILLNFHEMNFVIDNSERSDQINFCHFYTYFLKSLVLEVR